MRPRPPGRRALLGCLARGLFATACALGLTSCAELRYLSQAADGQRDIVFRERPLDDVIADAHAPPRVRALLAEIPAIKRFGERHGLKATQSYTKYSDLERRAAVWVVSAAEPLRFRSKSWSFPLVGSVPYLGWFHRRDAESFAASLRAQGWDVDLRGAGAYSTLGWFRDPVLSTMIAPGDDAEGDLAETVLHESLHATLYVPGQTTFNESVANFVGEGLASVYLDETHGPDSREKKTYVDLLRQGVRYTARMHKAYEELDALYKSGAPVEVQLAEKARILAALRTSLRLRRPVTNATLAQFKNYNSGVADLATLLDACGGDFARFVKALRRVDGASFSRPQQREIAPIIAPLVRAGCPAG